MRILSVDWDYFMDCTDCERMFMFPDGGNEDIGIVLSTQIWNIRYVDSRYDKLYRGNSRELTDIGVKRRELNLLKEYIVDNLDWNTDVMFADSHQDIYDFIKDKCIEDNSLEIINIDHHSDCYGIGDNVNCGNWANHLDRENFLDEFVWINNNSDEILSGDELQNTKVTMRGMDYLQEISGQGVDLIFICRSSVWSPPHLDKVFNEFHTFFEDELGMCFDKRFFVDRFLLFDDKLDADVEDRKSMIDTFNSHSISDRGVL